MKFKVLMKDFVFVIYFEISKFAAKVQQIFDIYKFICHFFQNNNNKYQKKLKIKENLFYWSSTDAIIYEHKHR